MARRPKKRSRPSKTRDGRARRSQQPGIETFAIGRAFPAEDPLASWTITVGMILNDANHVRRQLHATGHKVPEKTYYLRLASGHLLEAAKYLSETRRQWPEVAVFLDRLPAPARNDLELLLGISSPQHPLAGMLERSRHMLFHYPELSPGAFRSGHEEVAQALARLASEGHQSRIRFKGGLRIEAADDVALNMIAADEPDPEMRLVTGLHDLIHALCRFADAAFSSYWASREKISQDDPVAPGSS